MKDLTVCVLLYGDHPAYARRVLPAVARLRTAGADVRLGLNAVSAATRRVVEDLFPRIGPEAAEEAGVGPFAVHEKDDEPAPKYPAMRAMFALAPLREYVLWLDDDSVITAPNPAAWWRDLRQLFAPPGPGQLPVGVVGSVRYMKEGLVGNQPLWVQSRPWFAGKPVRRGTKTPFSNGGFWACPSRLLEKWDWPDPDIYHNGGDVMLGELLRQQGYRVVDHKTGILPNARLGHDPKPHSAPPRAVEGPGPAPDSAPRRGLKTTPVGVNWVDPANPKARAS